MTSLRLQHTLLLEQEFLDQYPDCDNIHIAYCWKHLPQSGIYFDRAGKTCFVYHTTGEMPYFTRQRFDMSLNPAKVNRSRPAYPAFLYHVRGVCFHVLLHRAIADIFLDNCDFTLTQVDHLDGNILNNNAFNLERVTPEENQRRKNVGYYTKRGLPVPDKYSTPQNYSIYLQNKKKK